MDAQVIRKMARLARLDETDGRDLAPDLLRVLAYVERLRGVDVEGVEPWTGDGDEITRADRPRPGLPPEEAAAGAPDVERDAESASWWFRTPPEPPA